jgi:integrase
MAPTKPTAPKPPARVRFPIIVKRGSVQVKVYRAKHANTAKGSVYVVAWHVGGTRKLKQFTSAAKAEAEAILKAEQLAAGRLDAAYGVSVEDTEALKKAKEIAGDVPFLAALEEWRKARDLCGGGELINAAQAWHDANGTSGRRAVTVPTVVDEFLSAKDRAGVNTHASYRHFLPKLKERFKLPIKDVTARALSAWLHETFAQGDAKLANPVTYNTGRKRLVALWRWARKEGYLPATAQTQAERIDSAREQHADIGIIDVKTFGRVLALVQEKHPEYLPVTVLAGFCGLRRSELHAQKWEDVQIDRGFVRVSSAKRNTPAKRLVPLSQAAMEWLRVCSLIDGKGGELVSPPWGFDRVRALAIGADIPLPENCFRHARISHRVAATGNIHETSLESGNSPQIINKHYRELVSKEDGIAWFELTPDRVAEIAKEAAQ